MVPLSCQALAIIKQVYKLSGDRDFVFIDDHGHRKRMNENTVNKMLGSMDDDTKIDMGLGQCSIILWLNRLWSKDAVERQISYQERNNVRAA